MTFFRIAKTMAAGHGSPDSLVMPYEQRVTPVITSPSGGRMIVGQLVDVQAPSTWLIPGTVQQLDYLEQQRQSVTTDEGLFDMPLLPDDFTHMAVLAHADRDGLNAELFSMATQNQKNRQSDLRNRIYIPIPEIPSF
jgi:hypothetical protein